MQIYKHNRAHKQNQEQNYKITSIDAEPLTKSNTLHNKSLKLGMEGSYLNLLRLSMTNLHPTYSMEENL
jgi:hypothetical protein